MKKNHQKTNNESVKVRNEKGHITSTQLLGDIAFFSTSFVMTIKCVSVIILVVGSLSWKKSNI